MAFNTDIAIVMGFLFITLMVGLGHGKDIKNIKDYALGGRNFSTTALVATLIATLLSGSGFVTTINKTYTEGLYFLLAIMGIGISLITVAYFLIPRMNEYLGKVSIAAAMGEIYGKPVQLVSAIVESIGSIGLIAVQFKVFGGLISTYLGLSPFISIVVAGGITTFYSAYGGIKAVTFTDMLQFFTFGVIIPLVSFIIWNDFYNDGLTISSILNDKKFDITTIFINSDNRFYELVFLFAYFGLPIIDAPVFQRIAASRDLNQAKNAFAISGVSIFLIILSIASIPIFMSVMNPLLEKSTLLGFIINTYSYEGLKGALICAIIAFTMSTADSQINTSSVLFTNDIYKLLTKASLDEIFVSRIFALVLGIGAIWLASTENDLLDIIIFTTSFSLPTLGPIFLLTTIGFRSSSKATLIAMLSSISCTSVWELYSLEFGDVPGDLLGIFVAMFINVSVLFLSHYLLGEPGGWTVTPGIKHMREEQKLARAARAERWEEIKQFNLLNFIRGLNPKYEGIYLRTGIYFILFSLITMFSTHTSLLGPGKYLLSIIFPFMLITGTIITIYPLWPQALSQKIRETIMHIWWPIALFYMLALFNGFFLLLSDFAPAQSAVTFLNILILITLYKWQISLISLPLGLFLSSKLYSSVYGPYEWKFDPGSPESVMIYLILLLGTAIIMFVKPKQQYLETTESEVSGLKDNITYLSNNTGKLTEAIMSNEKKIEELNSANKALNDQVDFYSEKVHDQQIEIERLGETSQRILNNVTHELRLPVGNVINFTELLAESLEKMEDKHIKQLSNEVIKNSERLSSMIFNMLDLAMLDVHKVKLNKKTMNLGELVSERARKCGKLYLGDKPIEIKLVIKPEVLVPVDPNYMRQVVDNLIINAIKFSQKGIVEVKVTRNLDSAIFVVRDEGMGIQKHELYDIFRPFQMSEATTSKAEGRGVGLALCKAAVLAHGGRITVESSGVGALFTVILPLPNAGED